MMDTERRRQDDQMIYDLEKRFDTHLQVYAANGKESARVAAVLERLEEHSRERDAKVDEMFDVYQSFKFGKKGIFWLIGTFTFIGGAILMAKQILK